MVATPWIGLGLTAAAIYVSAFELFLFGLGARPKATVFASVVTGVFFAAGVSMEFIDSIASPMTLGVALAMYLIGRALFSESEASSWLKSVRFYGSIVGGIAGLVILGAFMYYVFPSWEPSGGEWVSVPLVTAAPLLLGVVGMRMDR